MANDIAEFARGKPHIHRHAEIMEPEFDFFVAGTNVNVRGLIPFIGIEERSIWAPP